MIIDKKRRNIVWIVWAFTFPAGLWYAYKITPYQTDVNWTDAISFAILLVAAALIPIVVNNTPLSITQWITLAAFLKFGLFTEMILGQIAVLVVLLRLKLPKEQSYRYPLNSAMFILVSLISGQIYYWLGGDHEVYTISNSSFLSLAALYLLVYFFVNQGLFTVLFPVLFKMKRPIVSEDLLWEALLLLVIFPVGLILYFLYNTLGVMSTLFIGLPVTSMLLILNIYNRSQQMNHYLQEAVEFGHRLTERLKADEVLDVFIQNLIQIFPIDYLYFLENIDGERLELTRSYERGKYVELEITPMKKLEGISGLVWHLKQPRLYKEKKEWKQTVKGYIPSDVESILTVPAMKNNEVTGIIFIASSKKRIYEKYHLLIIDILSSYLAIALENARHYEKTKHQSERCPLTHLYNARVFTEKLEEEFGRIRKNEMSSLSLLIIDIDHFKHVNDTYGHQSGNEILCQLAGLFRSLVGNKGFLARYGGEEFAILLPDVEKETATLFGERIRKTIESRAFVLYDDLAEVRRKITIRITVSIGVASAPTDTDDPIALLRYADRALYIGAKRVGRNKVADYVG